MDWHRDMHDRLKRGIIEFSSPERVTTPPYWGFRSHRESPTLDKGYLCDGYSQHLPAGGLVRVCYSCASWPELH
jgi:hypothetical protein